MSQEDIQINLSVNTEERAERAEEALKNKYNEPFVVCEVFPQVFGEYQYQVQAYAESYPELRFSAYIGFDGVDISDAYVEKRVCAVLADQVMKNLDTLQGNYHVYVRGIGPQPLTSNADIGVDEYIELDQQNKFNVFVFYSPVEDKSNDVLNGISHMLDDFYPKEGSIRFCVLDDAVLEEVQDYLDVNDEIYFDFRSIESKMKYFDLPFHAGKIDMTESDIANRLKEVMG